MVQAKNASHRSIEIVKPSVRCIAVSFGWLNVSAELLAGLLQSRCMCLAVLLAERIPNLVPLLLNSPPTGNVPAVHRLQASMPSCLRLLLLVPFL